MCLYQVWNFVLSNIIYLLINYLFFLDSENSILLDIPKLIIDKSPNEELLSPDLPEVSDISDNENL